MEEPTREPRSGRIVLQAVDAGTGAALADDEITVRHLVRYPITLDATAVETVPSTEPYPIEHAVARDSLVVEVRLEAPSYHRLDTVLAVPRGSSAGPVTLRMARKLSRPDRQAAGPARPPPTETSPPTDTGDPDAGVDRGPLRAGNEAFREGDWAAATNAYLAMSPPTRPSGTYARDYVQARVRQGIAHQRLGEWGGALDALEEAVTFDDPGYRAYLLLARARCTVGRVEEGFRTLEAIDRIAPTLPAEERAPAHALAGFQEANCAYQEFARAREPTELLRTGAPAIQAYEAFLRQGESITPTPPDVAEAMEEARTRIEEIRERMRGR